MATTLFGIDILLTQAAQYQNLRIALVCNLASVTSKGIHSRIALKEAGFNLIRLFAPEHGFDAKGDDGAFIHHQIDEQTQIPIVSLYSEKLIPSDEDLADIDLVIVDLPDIGARFYTYLWTMTYVMESCEKTKKPVLILDRPNPMAYDLALAEGPFLEKGSSSFIGRFPIPITHNCTFAELAKLFKSNHYPNLSLKTIKMNNWSRKKNDGYLFVPTSPAIQKRETIYTYPGCCLFEGLNINEGRGSAYPFEQFGAPWINNETLASKAEQQLLGTTIEKVTYTPTFGLYENELCHGLRINPKQPNTFKSVSYFIRLIQIIQQMYPSQLAERNYLTNANPNGSKHLDKLLGIPNAFQKIIDHEISTEANDWEETMRPFLLYP